MLAHGVATGGFSCWRAFSTNAATPTRSRIRRLGHTHAEVRDVLPGHRVLASVGLPLLNGFIGEFLVLSGAFQARPIYGILAATGVIWSAGYLLWMYQRVFYGQVTHRGEQNSARPEPARENCAAPIAVAALVMGVAPILWLVRLIPPCRRRSRLHPVDGKVVGQ